MEKLTSAQQKFLNEMAKTKIRDRNPNNRTALALHRRGLLAFAFPVGWFVTPMGSAFVQHGREVSHV